MLIVDVFVDGVVISVVIVKMLGNCDLDRVVMEVVWKWWFNLV